MRVLAAAMAGAALFCAAPARADVTYDFVTSSAIGRVVNYGGFTNDGTGFTGFPLSLTFTDAGVASGEVRGSLSANLFGAPSQIGLAGFVGLSTYMDGATPSALYDQLSLDVRFDGTGAITGETLNFSGTDLTIGLVDGAASLGSDGLLNCTAVVESNACTATGSFVRAAPVPEPTGLAVLASGMLGLAARRRRHRSSSSRSRRSI